jgi:hypothetical protein
MAVESFYRKLDSCMSDFSQPDFSQDGSDGALPDGFKEWQWGVVYTIRAEMHAPLVRGKEYSSMAMARRRISKDRPFTAYAELYQRAAAIVAARVADWTLSGSDLRTWIAGQSWGSFGEAHPFAYASIGIGLLLPHAGQAVPTGLNAASPAELLEPAASPPQPGEVYNDFDFRDPSQQLSTICLFSFGEMVPSRHGLVFDPFIARAEELARRHRDLLSPESAGEPLSIVRREWMWATSPDVAVVHVLFETLKRGFETPGMDR